MAVYKELSPSLRTIMTPGPVEVDPRVLRAMSFPVLGQFDPEFTSLMNNTMAMLRELYMTSNVWSYPVDGTSRSGIEAVLVSLIQPGDKVLVPVYGRFGHLLVEISERCGAEVVFVETEWGGSSIRKKSSRPFICTSQSSLLWCTVKPQQVRCSLWLTLARCAGNWTFCWWWMPLQPLAVRL